MEEKLSPQKPEFLMAIKDPLQLKEWLMNNPMVVGFCMAGRSNVGKSSLINALFGKNTARISKTPGRTKEILIFRFHLPQEEHPFYLFDLPGYGFAKVSKEMSKNWGELLPLFFQYLSRQVCTINIVDSRHFDQEADKKFQEFIKAYDSETILVFNKMDKLKTQKERMVLNKAKNQIFKEKKWVKQIHFVSAEKSTGLEELKLGLQTYLLKKILI